MKKIYLFLVLIVLTISSINAQTTVYKAQKWADIKGNGGWAKAMDNPTIEKVIIKITTNNIKVTFGNKILNYKIISKKKFSEAVMNYNVSLNGKKYKLSVSSMPDGSSVINIDGQWMVSEFTEIKAE